MPYETADELTPEDVANLHERYRNYAWWDDRTHEDVHAAVDNTDVIVGLRDSETGELVAAGRVLTDFVYYGKIYDVIVAEPLRGDGLGRDLLDAIVGHPDLADVDVLTLDCREGLRPVLRGLRVRAPRDDRGTAGRERRGPGRDAIRRIRFGR